MDGRGKAEFKGLPAASEEGGRLPSVLLSGVSLGLGGKKCGIEGGGKTTGLNPGQLRPRPPAKPAPRLRAARIPVLNATNPEFQKFFPVAAEGQDCRFGSKSGVLSPTRWEQSHSPGQPGALPASRGRCWASPARGSGCRRPGIAQPITEEQCLFFVCFHYLPRS